MERQSSGARNAGDRGRVRYWAADGPAVTAQPGGVPRLVEEGREKRYLAKEVIFREGERPQRAFLIRDGLVKMLGYLPNGRARIIRLHARDHWLGLEGLLGTPYEHTAIAIDDVEVVHLPVASLQRHVRTDPETLRHLMLQWHRDLIQADRWIAEFSTGGIQPRVARLLEFLAELEFGASSNRVGLLRVQEMAEILGVTQESVSRVLADFKRNRILRRAPDFVPEIYHLDMDRLQQKACI